MKRFGYFTIFIVGVLLFSVVLSFSVGSVKAQTVNVKLVTGGDGQASITSENVHTSNCSAKLVIPTGATPGSYAMVLYPYDRSLSSISSFSIYTAYWNATPRFVMFMDTNNDGQADFALLSDYQFGAQGEWQLMSGGNRWGWTQSNLELSSYGQTWNQLDYWKSQYGNATVLYVGLCLEYYAVYDQHATGQPLYADELVLNGVTYNIGNSPTAPTSTSTPSPVSSPQPTPISSSNPVTSPLPTPLPTTSPVTKPMPVINLTCSSSTSELGFKVYISGSLKYQGAGLSGAPVLISYSLDGGTSWIELTFLNTQEDGSFSAQWLPSATGNFLLKAMSPESTQYSASTSVVNLAVTPSDQANSIFSISSNSTLSQLAFNSATSQLSFTVSGPSGTTGYVNAYIPKSLMTTVSGLKVLMDGQQINYTTQSLNDCWLLHFTYHHSTHRVTLIFNSSANQNGTNSPTNWSLYIIIAAIVVGTFALLSIVSWKKNQRSITGHA